MTLFHALILSVVEGITEFLPVSSTGHLVLVSRLLRIPDTDFSRSFDIIIQFGAILAVVSLYWKSVRAKPKMLLPVLYSFLPTAVVGLLVYKTVKDVLLSSPHVIALSLALGGVVLIGINRFLPNARHQHIADMPMFHAVIIGLGQSLAIIPGVSRAAATIITALILGYTKETAVEYSFLLAVPTIAAAAGLDAVKNTGTLIQNLPLLAVGLIGSWITAVFAVSGFVGYVKRHSFAVFGWYRILVAAAFFLLTGAV